MKSHTARRREACDTPFSNGIENRSCYPSPRVAVLGDRIEGRETVPYPMFVDLSGRRCVLVGGGEVASRKARKLLESGAEIVVISPEVKPELESAASELHLRPYREGDLAGAHLAFAAASLREVNAAVAREAHERGVPVNVADESSEGDFAAPSVLRRGGLQVAVSTGGASPTLAREVRMRLEDLFGDEWAGLVEELGAARQEGSKDDPELNQEVSRCLLRLSG